MHRSTASTAFTTNVEDGKRMKLFLPSFSIGLFVLFVHRFGGRRSTYVSVASTQVQREVVEDIL